MLALINPFLAALNLLPLPGAHGLTVYINPQTVVSLRSPRPGSQDHFAPGVHCLVQTSDGKIVATTDTCDAVAAKLR